MSDMDAMNPKQWWRRLTGREMAERTEYSRGYYDGFAAGMKSRGAVYMAGFAEGRDSVRANPLGDSKDEDEGSEPCH